MPAATVRAEPRDAEEIFYKNEKSFGKSRESSDRVGGDRRSRRSEGDPPGEQTSESPTHPGEQTSGPLLQ